MSTKSPNPLQNLVAGVSRDVTIHSPVLEAGHFIKDNTHSPVYSKGKSAVVFSFQLNKQIKAIKIWPAAANEYMRNRYLRIEHFLHNTDLPCFTNCAYLQEAVTLKGKPHDVLLMDWAGRQHMKEYIGANLDQKEKLNALAAKFLHLHLMLNQAGVAHGHLHTGNIFTDANGELKLIDYDSLYIKDTTEEEALGQVYTGYCHPASNGTTMSNKQADYFAALVIYTGIKAIACDPVLWGRYKVAFQEDFLFTAADFLDLTNASVYKYLRKNQAPQMDKLLDILLLYCQEKDPGNLKPFYTYLSKDLSPLIHISTDESKSATVKSSVVVTAANDIASHAHITIPSAQVPVQNKIVDPRYNTSNTESDVFSASEIAGNLAVPQSSPAFIPVMEADNTNLQTAEDIPPVSNVAARRSTSRKVYDDGSLKKQRTKFLAAFAVVCIVIIAASYLLGEFADNANKYDFKTDSEASSEPVKPAAEHAVAASAAKQKTTVIKKAGDTAKLTTPVALPVARPAALPVAATQNAAQIITKEKPTERIAVAPPLKNKTIEKNKLLPVEAVPAASNGIAAEEKDFVKAIAKSSAQKTNSVKKQPETSFKIGAPPKQ